MALCRPPKFAVIPATYIFDADLDRETYRAGEQLIAWMWTTKYDHLSTTLAELATAWGIGDRAARYRLETLHAGQYFVVLANRGRLYITLGPRLTGQDPQQTQTQSTGDDPITDTDHTEQTQDTEHTDTEHRGGNGAKVKAAFTNHSESENSFHIPNNISCCSDPLDLKTDRIEQQQHNSAAPELAASLVEAGVFPDVAAGLAADPWLSLKRIDAWLANLRAQGSRIANLPAVLAANLRAHREPPEPGLSGATCDPRTDPGRYLGGAYAAYIEH